MTPDPGRQWYVYFNETELGPFLETDLISKFTSKEFDATAFVYTDGMSNWEAVNSVEVLKASLGGKPQAAETPVEELSEAPLDFGASSESDESAGSSMSLSISSTPEPEVGSDEVLDSGFELGESAQGEDAFAPPSLTEENLELSESSNWGQSLEAAADGAGDESEPLQLEPLGEGIELDEPLAASDELPSGEFTEELSGSRAGAFPEDEALLEDSPEPAAGSRTGIAGPRRKILSFLRTVLILALLLIVGLGVLFFSPLKSYVVPTLRSVSDIVGVDLVKELQLESWDESAKSSGPESGEPSAAGAGAETAPPILSLSERIWTELQSIRAADNGGALPVRLATENLMENRPILVGVVSPLVVADKKLKKLRVAIFPNSSQNLMVRPKVWIKEIPLFDEYFAIGPITADGAPLSVGTYTIMFRGDDASNGRTVEALDLGSQVFQVGSWPAEPELATRLKDLENQRLLAAAEERKELENRLESLIAIAKELEDGAMQHALKTGAVSRKAWLSYSQGWQRKYQNLGEELRGHTDYRFYAAALSGLQNFHAALKRIHSMTEAYSQGGAKALKKVAGVTRYTDLWIPIKNELNGLREQVADLEKQAISVPKIEEDQQSRIKKLLMGE